MKSIHYTLWATLIATAVCQAQPITEPGWFDASSLTREPPTDVGALLQQAQAQAQSFSLVSGGNEPSQPLAEAVTPEIQALARGLENDPVRIYNYVHDHIRHVFYFGSKKGAQLTLLEKSGNDFDQCALLVALLRAAGYTGTQYQFGWMILPYDIPDGTDHDMHHWLQLTLTNSSSTWLTTSNYLVNLIYTRGYPSYAAIWGNNVFTFQRMWVTLPIGGTTYYLDPSFKVSERLAGINLASAMGLSSNALVTAAAGTTSANYVTNLNEGAVRNTLAGYTCNLLGYIQNNYANASVEQILSGWRIVPSTNTTLPTNFLFTVSDFGGVLPVLTYSNQPTNMMSKLTVAFAGTNHQWYMPQFQGQRLSLTFDSSGLAQLWQDDALLLQKSTATSDTNVALNVHHPVGYWDGNNNIFVDRGAYDQFVTNGYSRVNATYNLLYAFEPDWGWLQERQNQLDAYRQQGLSDTSRQVVSEVLNILGLNWLLQTAGSEQILAAQLNMLPMNYHRLGRIAQESGNAYYVDAYMQLSGQMPNSGVSDSTSLDHYTRHFVLKNYLNSALEHGVIEQLQSSNLTAASTVKMLELAVTNRQAIYIASSANWTTVQAALLNYDSYTLNTLLPAYVNAGYYLLLPQNGSNHLAGAGSWAGYGIVAQASTMKMLISGGYHGGYPADPTATLNPTYFDLIGQSQPDFPSTASPSTPNRTIADPVDTADGTFQAGATDLTLGQTEPRGITFGRFYNSRRRYASPVGMAGGWIHNYYLNATEASAPQAALGGTTPAQMAPMLVAVASAIGFFNDMQGDPKNWTVTALIAKWGIDQLTKGGVSVTLGKDLLQFVRQPDGSLTPPANCTWTLGKTNTYTLRQRHGNAFKFDSLGRLTNIVDQYSQGLTVAYNASNWVQTVTDWTNRSLTFNYTGTPSRLTSVSDGARTVSYGYSTAYSAQGDLVSVTDQESKTTTFAYDTNHQITAEFDALSQLVVSNVYDAFGHIQTQYTQGATNKSWQIYWSGWQTVEQDPVGSKRRFFYDDKTRLIAEQDALGNTRQTSYDGQDHVVLTVSPLNETNQLVYDGNHNLLVTIDPLGYSNQFSYDSQNNLTRAVDGRGNPSTFGYNGQFSLTGSTNGAGDWVTYSYNTDGTLKSGGDSGSITTYGYDQWGQVNSTTWTNGLGSESFVNTSLGDVSSHTDGRGFVTSFQYNSRRELTNLVAPTNLTVKVAYDAVGNPQTVTDARTNSTTSFWSPTRHLTGVAFPATPQGTPATTNLYDNRDWLSRTLDPLQQATVFTNDAAGRQLSVTDPLLRTARFGYDPDGRKVASTNAAQEFTLQQWDQCGQLANWVDPASHAVGRGYDAAGNQITLTNRNGKRWQFQFDAANRLTNTITPRGRSTKQAFNNRGFVKSVTSPSTNTTTFDYDARGRRTNRVDQVGTTVYWYDPNNNLTDVFENGKTNSWGFDAYDRVSSYRDPDGNLVQYRRDQNGNVTSLIYPGNRVVNYSYDSLNRLTNVTDWASGQTTLVYDLANRLTSITRPNGTVRLINYDAAGETTNIIEKTTSGFPIAFYQLNYDRAARVQWEFSAPLPQTNTAPPARTMTYNDDNQIATFRGPTMGSAENVGYDVDGNLTSGPLTNDTLVSYGYNARNQLTGAGGHAYAYDPAGNRVAITNGVNVTRFVINPNAALSQVLMRVRAGATNYYIYGPGLLYEITETATTTSTLTYHYDLRGSTIALTDNNGNVTDRVQYSAYGMINLRGGTNDTPFLYNGRYGVMTDPNGLLCMRARYYNAYICRFINPDPAVFAGGLNWYCYADGNPISNLDPFGLCSVDETGGFSWLPTVNGAAAVLIPGAGSAQNAYTYFAQGNYANGTASAVSSVGESVLGGLMYANSGTSSSLGGLGNWISSLWRSGTSAAEGGTTLYRAVGPAELGDIQANNLLRNLGSAEGKYFTTSAEAASSYAKQAVKAFGDPPYTIIQTRVPNSIFEGLMPATVDRGIPAWVIPNNRLPGLVPQVLDTMPIPHP